MSAAPQIQISGVTVSTRLSKGAKERHSLPALKLALCHVATNAKQQNRGRELLGGKATAA
jgi:hypothetical protein